MSTLSNIISMQETDANPQFAADILNAVMKEYLVYDRAQKTLSATNMISFIDNQLALLSNEVKGSEKLIEQYKQNTKILDVNSSADAALAQIKDVESQRQILKLQLIAIDQLKELASLKAEGVLTEEEFAQQKAKLLAS